MSFSPVTRLRSRLREVPDSSETNGLGDGGFTLAELVMTMSILVMVSVMAIAVMLSTQQATKLVSWQSNANSELRFISENTFAELETARPRSLCLGADGKSQLAMPSTCTRVQEGIGSPLESAGEKHVCYLSHRVDPALGTDSKIYSYQRVCLAIIGEQLYQVEFLANTSNLNAPTGTPTYRVVGNIDPANSSFAYYGKRFNTTLGREETVKLNLAAAADTALAANPLIPTGTRLQDKMVAATTNISGTFTGQLTGPIKTITRLEVKLSVITRDGKHTRDAVYDVTLRGARYQNERCWTGEKVAKNVDANTDGSLSC
jgi:hypothetical protein